MSAAFIHEPAVALTDYGIALEAAVFAALLICKDERAGWTKAMALFFSAISVGAALGGTVHGFLPDASRLGHRICWPATLISIAVAAFAAWRIGALLIFSRHVVFWVTLVASCDLVLYSIFVVLGNDGFFLAILNYLPAVFFWMWAWTVYFSRTKRKAALVAVAGLILTLVASAVQHLQIALYRPYLDHNAFYHLLQMVAFYLIFWAGEKLSGGAQYAIAAHAD